MLKLEDSLKPLLSKLLSAFTVHTVISSCVCVHPVYIWQQSHARHPLNSLIVQLVLVIHFSSELACSLTTYKYYNAYMYFMLAYCTEGLHFIPFILSSMYHNNIIILSKANCMHVQGVTLSSMCTKMITCVQISRPDCQRQMDMMGRITHFPSFCLTVNTNYELMMASNRCQPYLHVE